MRGQYALLLLRADLACLRQTAPAPPEISGECRSRTGHMSATSFLPSEIADLGVGRGTDRAATTLESIDRQFVCAWLVEQALLWENADLEIDRPRITPDQWTHPFE